MHKFKIFYSWQSDLPGNKTRSFIRECIDDAIDLAQESEAIEAERDEATKDTTGSPNIVTTLFSKIDDCDLFVADLTLGYTEDSKKQKRSPNPNVLLELGYAVKTLGWERVICLCNADYGEGYPFDIAHNRITSFSFEGKTRNEVKSEIAKIVFVNIRDLRKLPPRAKPGMATFVVGCYDSENKKVVPSLMPIDLQHRESFTLHNEELIEESRLKLMRILNLTEEINASQGELKSKDEEGNLTENHSVVIETDDAGNTVSTWDKESVHAMALSFRGTEQPVKWNDIGGDKKLIKQWLDFEASDDLFNLGGLTKSTQLFSGSTLNGTVSEKEKYNALIDLASNLAKLDLRTNYLKTFEGLYFIPLAIQNISSVQDDNISVFVKIELGEIVEPDEKLIYSDIDGCQGLICRDEDDDRNAGMITELFAPDADGHIHLEEAPFDPADLQFKSPLPGYQSQKDADDYRLELQQWIAISAGDGYYEFDIESLRPNECKWFSYGMLIRPDDGKVKIHYNISSAHSSGDLEGELVLNENQKDVRL